MTPDPNQIAENRKDKIINDTLAALRTAEPPAGMAARISARLTQQPAAHHAPSLAPSATWWRGALTGAAFAAAALCILLLCERRQSSQHPQPIATNQATTAARPELPPPVTVSTVERHPCPTPAVLQLNGSHSNVISGPHLLAADFELTAPSHPAPILPLTAQERLLAHFVRNSNPRQLAALALEEEAHLEIDRSISLTPHQAASPVADPYPATPASPGNAAAMPTDQPTSAATEQKSAPDTLLPNRTPEEQK